MAPSAKVTEPWNAPPAGATPMMDGFVADSISTFTGEMGRQPTCEEHAQIMTGYMPSQTLMNRSFWTAATSSGIVVNGPVKKWFTVSDAEPKTTAVSGYLVGWPRREAPPPSPVSTTE